MTTLGQTFSKNPYRDKQDDLVAINLDAIADLIRIADLLRSQNARIRALEAGQRPLTTRIAQKNATPANTEAA